LLPERCQNATIVHPTKVMLVRDEPPHGLLASAEAGDAEAQNALGRFYGQHPSLANGLDLAQTWFRRAADQGLASAKHNLGVLALRSGRYDVAQSWFRSASQDGWVPSTFALAVVLDESGQKQEAVQLYELAARKGHADAQDAMARTAFDLDTPEGYVQSRYWSELAAAQGVASAEARLGAIYHEGLGVERDAERAASLFLSAARSGHPGAQLMIGVAYEVGAGVEVDLLESAYWLSRAADAQDRIARHYLTTRVLPRLSQEQKNTLDARLRETS
jgi:uncharacterized protein